MQRRGPCSWIAPQVKPSAWWSCEKLPVWPRSYTG
jgi:hypothetical protein